LAPLITASSGRVTSISTCGVKPGTSVCTLACGARIRETRHRRAAQHRMPPPAASARPAAPARDSAGLADDQAQHRAYSSPAAGAACSSPSSVPAPSITTRSPGAARRGHLPALRGGRRLQRHALKPSLPVAR
jgi:hypothetical protein